MQLEAKSELQLGQDFFTVEQVLEKHEYAKTMNVPNSLSKEELVPIAKAAREYLPTMAKRFEHLEPSHPLAIYRDTALKLNSVWTLALTQIKDEVGVFNAVIMVCCSKLVRLCKSRGTTFGESVEQKEVTAMAVADLQVSGELNWTQLVLANHIFEWYSSVCTGQVDIDWLKEQFEQWANLTEALFNGQIYAPDYEIGTIEA